MRVVVAPDKFRGTLSALAAAEAMERGIASVLPAARIVSCPIADGGEGTMAVIRARVGGDIEETEVTGPTGATLWAPLVALPNSDVLVEMASASGISLLRGRPEPLRSHSVGTGELLRAALRRSGGAAERSILVGIGGSASTDGGTGAARAVGWRFLDARGRELPPGGGALRFLARIDASRVETHEARVSIVGLCDVDTPLVGERGTARVFAPQKGASVSEVEILSEAMSVLAERTDRDLGASVGALQHGGAGGGMGAGLVAFFGGGLESGFDVVAAMTGLADAVHEADLVITGEGRVDEQTLAGKAAAGVARLAARARVPCAAIAGEIALPQEQLRSLFCAWRSLDRAAGGSRSVRSHASALELATAEMLKDLL